MGRRTWRRAAAGASLAVVALAVVAAVRWSAGEPAPAVMLTAAAFPAAMAALPDGGLLVGERLTGRILRVGPQGASELIATVGVSTDGEQRGLLGLAVRRDDVFVSFTAPSGELRISRLGGGVVWAGPPSADRANGGRIAFAPTVGS